MTNDEKGNVLVSKSSTQLRGCDESDSADRNMQAIEWSVNSDGGEYRIKRLSPQRNSIETSRTALGIRLIFRRWPLLLAGLIAASQCPIPSRRALQQ